MAGSRHACVSLLAASAAACLAACTAGCVGAPGFDVSSVTFPYCPVDDDAVDALWGSMTLRARIGQHVMTAVERSGNDVSAASAARIGEYLLGGVFLSPISGVVVGDPLATAALVRSAKAMVLSKTGVPAFVSLDQEGGPNAVVNSLTGGTDTIGSMPIGATRDPVVAFEQFDIMGREIRALGFNMDFAPVADTLRSTRNGNMNTRAFGPDPDLNAALAVAAFAALQHNLVLPTAKHFPGDGLTDGNTHTTFVVNDASRDHLESTILKPFRAAIAAGCDGVMTIPACYTALDPDRSAITSRYVNTGLLRSEIGFKGLIVTDSLGMKGAQIGMEAGRLPGVEALKAGADILLHLTIDDEGLKDLYDGIEQALADGSYDPAEFEASTRRILRMKQKYCLFENPAGPDPADPSSILAHLARPEDAALSASHGDRAVVLLEDNGVLPLAGKRVLYVGPDRVFQDPGSTWYNATDKHFGEALAAHDPSVRSVTFMLPFDPAGVAAEVADRVDGVDVVVLGTLQGRFSMEQQQLVEWLIGGAGRPLVHVMLGVPFDYFQTEGRVAAAVAVMGCRSAMVDAGARFLYGKIPASGAMAYVFEGEGSGAGVDPIPGGPHPVSGDRCAEQGVSCSGDGLCVDTGTVVGCVCQPNWHPSAAGTDCVPDGSGG